MVKFVDDSVPEECGGAEGARDEDDCWSGGCHVRAVVCFFVSNSVVF